MVEDRLLRLVVMTVDLVDETNSIRLGVQATLDGRIVAEFLFGCKHQREHDPNVRSAVLDGRSASDFTHTDRTGDFPHLGKLEVRGLGRVRPREVPDGHRIVLDGDLESREMGSRVAVG